MLRLSSFELKRHMAQRHEACTSKQSQLKSSGAPQSHKNCKELQNVTETATHFLFVFCWSFDLGASTRLVVPLWIYI